MRDDVEEWLKEGADGGVHAGASRSVGSTLGGVVPYEGAIVQVVEGDTGQDMRRKDDFDDAATGIRKAILFGLVKALIACSGYLAGVPVGTLLIGVACYFIDSSFFRSNPEVSLNALKKYMNISNLLCVVCVAVAGFWFLSRSYAGVDLMLWILMGIAPLALGAGVASFVATTIAANNIGRNSSVKLARVVQSGAVGGPVIVAPLNSDSAVRKKRGRSSLRSAIILFTLSVAPILLVVLSCMSTGGCSSNGNATPFILMLTLPLQGAAFIGAIVCLVGYFSSKKS